MGKWLKCTLPLLLLGLLMLPGQRKEEPVAAPSAYTLREYEGCVAIYCGGEAQPGTVTDIEVRLLPSRDRELLRSGLSAADLRELSCLLEDLGS